MAVTAEQGDYIGFDRLYYESARRLALVPAIGQTALGESFKAVEQRKTEEIVDGIAEAIPGIVSNVRPYNVASGVLVAEDGQPMQDLLRSGLRHAVDQASQDSFLAPFGPARARHELDETGLWQKMVNGETGYNTLQVFSPYSEEYLTEYTIGKLQMAGQEPGSRRAMLRIAHWDGQKMHILTRSIDNSSVEVLKEASKKHDGYEYSSTNSTDMLGERRGFNMSAEDVMHLADRIVAQADLIISQRLGEKVVQGRPVSEAHDTQKYVESQQAIIKNLVKIGKQLASEYPTYDSFNKAWEKQLYDHTALIKERMLRNDDRAVVDIGRAAFASGVAAEVRGETYNMCGTIISANGQTQAGEGTGMESVKSLIGKKVTCPECKEKVVIPSTKLNSGILCCPDCKYEVDVCTGQVYAKSQAGHNRSEKARMGIYEVAAYKFSKDMRRIDEELAVQKMAKKAKEERKVAV